MSDSFQGSDIIDQWLQPLDLPDGPCGADLEYDNDFLALTQAAAGKPESQFGAAVPPDWRAVRTQAEALFDRTRDLRVAVYWLRALLNLEGFVALPAGLRLLHDLLDGFWESLHPVPDDGDAYARMNALAELREAATALGDVRRAVVFSARGVGEVRVRSIEVALGLIAARDDEASYSRDQIAQMLEGAVAQDPDLRTRPARALAELKRLIGLIDDRVGMAEGPDLKPLQSLLYQLTTVMPAEAAADAPAVADEADAGQPAAPVAAGAVRAVAAGPGLSGGVHSRDDALKAIDMVCEFLERTEPTNPAPLLLRRARRLVNQNFLQLMKELAPDALAEVAKLMGVDPDTVQSDS